MWIVVLGVAFWCVDGYAFAVRESKTLAVTSAAIWLAAFFFLPFGLSVIVRAILLVTVAVWMKIEGAL